VGFKVQICIQTMQILNSFIAPLIDLVGSDEILLHAVARKLQNTRNLICM